LFATPADFDPVNFRWSPCLLTPTTALSLFVSFNSLFATSADFDPVNFRCTPCLLNPTAALSLFVSFNSLFATSANIDPVDFRCTPCLIRGLLLLFADPLFLLTLSKFRQFSAI
jgi:hypothetical protein